MPTFTVNEEELESLAQGLNLAVSSMVDADEFFDIIGSMTPAQRTALVTDLTDLMRRLADNGNNYEPWEDRKCGGCQLAARMRSNGNTRAGCADHEAPTTMEVVPPRHRRRVKVGRS
jgi:hypothetical protein